MRPTGRRIASAAPSAAPDEVPSTYGSASGLRTMPWNVAPATARPAPTSGGRQDPRQPQVPDDRLGRGGPASGRGRARSARWRMTPMRVGRADPRSSRRSTPATSSDEQRDEADRPRSTAGRPRSRPARPTGREVRRRSCGSAIGRPRLMAPATAATRSGYIASARLRSPVARRGPGRVISVSLTGRMSPFLTARQDLPAGPLGDASPASACRRR